jgi:hypothetical protein
VLIVVFRVKRVWVLIALSALLKSVIDLNREEHWLVSASEFELVILLLGNVFSLVAKHWYFMSLCMDALLDCHRSDVVDVISTRCQCVILVYFIDGTKSKMMKYTKCRHYNTDERNKGNFGLISWTHAIREKFVIILSLFHWFVTIKFISNYGP